MNINEALATFSTEMLAKFAATEHKHPGQSVIYDSIAHLSLEEISNHLMGEIMELYNAESPKEQQGESVDVANLAFLTWWKHEEMEEENSWKI